MIIRPRCQQQLFLGDHSFAQIVHGRTYRGLALRESAERVVAALRGRTKPRFGAPSAFAPGDWVRVLDEPGIRATLDARGRTGGLPFSPQQFAYCGRVTQVTKVVRRIIDDMGRMRPVSRTVLLEGITCDGVDGTSGCGRCCPLLFRDAWLERAEAPVDEKKPAPRRMARIRSLHEIQKTLDVRGRTGTVALVPEQADYAGQRFPIIRKIEHVFEADRDVDVREPIYILDMPRCRGAALGIDGPCDRGCSLLWHGDWLEIEELVLPVEEERAKPVSVVEPKAAVIPLAATSPGDRMLLARAGEGAPAFLRPEFLGLIGAREGRGEPVVVLASGETGAAALTLRREGRTLSGLATEDTPRFDMIGDAAVVPRLWAALRDDRGWDVLDLEDVPDGSPLATTLLDLARADGFLVAIRPGLRSPWFELDGFESRLTAKFRANLRRCARNLGDPTLERVAPGDRAAFDEAIAIELASWKGERGTAIGSNDAHRRLYEELFVATEATSPLFLQFLRAEGRRIAFEIANEDRTTHYALKISFHPDFARHSPGHLLIERAAEDARTRGLSRLDFMGWDQEWKRKWTDRYVEHVSPTIYRQSVLGLLEYSRREVVKAKLVELKHAVETTIADGE